MHRLTRQSREPCRSATWFSVLITLQVGLGTDLLAQESEPLARECEQAISEAYRLELVTQLPWGEASLSDSVWEFCGGSTTNDGCPPVRNVPRLFRSPDNTLWLVGSNDATVHLVDGEWESFDLSDAALGHVMALAPTSDGGVIGLGVTEAPDHNVLARLGPDGTLIWRLGGPRDHHLQQNRELRGLFSRLVTPPDDWSVYLPPNRDCGELVSVDVEDGSLSLAVDLGDYDVDSVFVRDQSVYRIQYVESERSRYWVRRSLDGGDDDYAPIDDACYGQSHHAAGPLPNGQVLIGYGQPFFWVGPDGRAVGQLHLAGVARSGGELAVATPQEDSTSLCVTHFVEGEQTRVINLQLPATVSSGRLTQFDDQTYTVWSSSSLLHPGALVTLDQDGGSLDVEDLAGRGMSTSTTDRLGQIDGLNPVIEPDGSVLLVGADALGVFVVRLRRTP